MSLRFNDILKISRLPGGQPEIFLSVQGEGVSTGRPSVFLRLADCNLRCRWCDTRYTWDWKKYRPSEQVLAMPVTAVKEIISGFPCKNLVVTGGEPLLQQPPLIKLLKLLAPAGINTEIETNGTMLPRKELAALVNQWNVSPKLASSGNPPELREVAGVYRFFNGLPGSYFKFVIKDQPDFAGVKELIARYHISPDKVVLLPEARNRKALIERSRWLVELCRVNGFRFSTRLHILLWGNKRGK